MNENQKLTLLAMADHLQHNVEDAQFDMDTWEYNGWHCGTIGCAIGHTVHLIHGLHLVNRQPTFYFYESDGAVVEAQGFRAVRLALGLGYYETSWLFHILAYSDTHPTRKTVYTRIRAFAKGELECPPRSLSQLEQLQ